jgi:hypothetical protein
MMSFMLFLISASNAGIRIRATPLVLVAANLMVLVGNVSEDEEL